jgi:diguanylate cyclase (GGDEF)-like protein
LVTTAEPADRLPRSMVRPFITYAAITLVPVLLLGVALAASYRAEARRRGLAEASSESALVAETAVDPLLDGHRLTGGLSSQETASLQRLVARAISEGTILRLRVRDTSGHVVFSGDGSGYKETPESGAAAAGRGAVIVKLTHLNADSNDDGPSGVAAVEVYRPLTAGSPPARVGVLEVYLPYAPIKADVTAGLHDLYRDLSGGLVLLYVVLFLIAVSVSRGLRRQVALNAFLAEHDSLTGLPNRTLFHHRARAAVASATRHGEQAAMAIIDLDRFKEVNDTLGHHNGDRLLAELARRLDSLMRPDDTVARLGGDEFGVIMRRVSDADAALSRLRDVIDHEVDVAGLPVSVEASIGFVLIPDDGTDVDDLVQRADVAMYIAKSRHAGVLHYDAGQDHYDASNLALISELRRAIDSEELLLHYQPKTTLSGGHVRSVEALVRWQHAHGLLYPDRFLPLAEQTDVIDRLTGWVLKRALTDLRDLGESDLTVAVNVSARNLSRPDFARSVLDIIGEVGMSADRLIIEITETAILTDPGRAATILAELSAAGVRISLDDFGCGQTSLGYLSAMPLHELKIDKSFVADMLINPRHGAIVRSVVDLGHNLALTVVGEGVESEDVLVALRDAGCDIAQGFLLAHPMPLDDLRLWLSETGSSETSKHRPRVATGASLV